MNEENFGQAVPGSTGSINPAPTPAPIPQPETQPVAEATAVGYGFAEDDARPESLTFGLTAGETKLTKFEFNPNGGAGGTPQDCVDIVFNVNGRDVSGRVFPVTRAYDGGNEVTDPRHPAFQAAVKELNAFITHILKAFVSEDNVRTAFNAPIASFQQYATVAQQLLPPNFSDVSLDIFLQYEWSIREDNDRTWLRLPKNVKHGKFVCAHIPPQGGDWTEETRNGKLYYKDGAGNEHPFERSKWYMENNFAKLQEQASIQDVNTPQAAGGSTQWQ